jgi:hypothetical protein
MDATRISRGFHRLALFLAAIPLLVGGYFSVVYAVGEASMRGQGATNAGSPTDKNSHRFDTVAPRTRSAVASCIFMTRPGHAKID